MLAPRPRRDRQRGNSLLLALIVLSSLATLGSLTVVSVQSSLKASTTDRSQTIAMYAAESGAAAAMLFLRNNFDPSAGWSAFVDANSASRALSALELPSSGALPGAPNNMFSLDQNASFTVELINNRTDPGNATGDDNDGIVIIHSIGHGPQGSVAVIEWEVQRIAPDGPAPAPPAAVLPPPLAPWAAAPFPPPVGTKSMHLRSWRIVL